MTRITRAALLTAALIQMTWLLTSCNSAPGTTPAGAARPGADGRYAGPAHAAHENARAARPSGFSIYDLESEWQDQQALTLTLGDLAGRPRVIAMVYTRCAYACPAILKDMKRIEGEMNAAGIDAGYVMVSIDPARDTPQRLHEYAMSTLLDPSHWTLLTGTDDGVLELAALLGVRFRRISAADLEHSNVITLVDGTGRIVHRQVGLDAEPQDLVTAASDL